VLSGGCELVRGPWLDIDGGFFEAWCSAWWERCFDKMTRAAYDWSGPGHAPSIILLSRLIAAFHCLVIVYERRWDCACSQILHCSWAIPTLPGGMAYTEPV